MEPLAEGAIDRLLASGEHEWVEFKVNWFEPKRVGEYASALSNSAAIHGQTAGSLVWGVDDAGLVVGTEVDPTTQKVGGQPFPLWLAQRLRPDQHGVRFLAGDRDGKRLVAMVSSAASLVSVKFDGRAFIRVGSTTPKLEAHPDLERRLNEALSAKPADSRWKVADVRTEEAATLLDLPGAMASLKLSALEPSDALGRLASLGLVDDLDSGAFWSISGSAVLLFARRLNLFGPDVARKGPRVILYQSDDRQSAVGDLTGNRGYANGFEGLVRHISERVPIREHLRDGVRVTDPIFPLIAIRELLGNALIHQDLNAVGAAPLIEIFDSRIEISNPGVPMIPVERLIDEAPRSRNELIASTMRRVGVCEERGSGIDKVVDAAELAQLPPPDFVAKTSSFVATLFAPRAYADMRTEERIRACYQHACLRFVDGNKTMTNTTLRERFGLQSKRAAQISRVLSDTLDAGYIVRADPSNRSRAQAAYFPFWAERQRRF